MNPFKNIFNFLDRLHQNNSKAWMDANRQEYHRIRDAYIDWLDELNQQLIRIDPHYADTPGRQAIHRINNNLMFHPDKPVYKSHFGATMDRVKGKSDFYIHLGREGSFIAGGYYHPPSSVVSAVRAALDYDGEVFRDIIGHDEFRRIFGNLYDDDSLKTSPKSYPADHPHIDLLRLKSYAAEHAIQKDTIMAGGFMDYVVELYTVLIPFRDYLNRAVAHAEEMND